MRLHTGLENYDVLSGKRIYHLLSLFRRAQLDTYREAGGRLSCRLLSKEWVPIVLRKATLPEAEIA